MFNTSIKSTETLQQIRKMAVRLRGDAELAPQASIVVPVNAQGDLAVVLPLLNDLDRYAGPYRIEIILVINNYPPETPPEEIAAFRSAGISVVAEPSVRKPGEVVIISARACGAKAARANITIHFDADCRIANPTALLNWYIETLQNKAGLAYSHVTYYDLRPLLSVQVKVAIHHFVRFLKRSIVGIPTTRGSNYAIQKSLFENLYQQGKLSVDLQVGPAAKLMNARVAYSGKKSHYVSTSGRRFQGGWGKIWKYFHYRLNYNIRSLAVLKNKDDKDRWEGFEKENLNRQSFNKSASKK